jgi:hypothetical protein
MSKEAAHCSIPKFKMKHVFLKDISSGLPSIRSSRCRSRIQGTGYEKYVEDHANEDETKQELKEALLSSLCSCQGHLKTTRAIVGNTPLRLHERRA